MTLPAVTKTWTISPNNRIPFTSVNNTTANFLLAAKNFLKGHGYTVKGSSNGTTASPASTLITDGVDRWSTVADVTTRGAGSGNAQSWIVLHDGNGVDILLAYQGAADDDFKVSYSVGDLWTTQSTNTFQPTATDVVSVTVGSSMVGSSAIIADRIWNGWVDSQNKLCRFMLFAGGSAVGSVWGVELLQNECSSPAVFSPAVWGFSFTANQALILNGTSCGRARVVVGSVPASDPYTLFFGMEWTGLVSNTLGIVKNELQGATGYPFLALSIAGQTSGANGKLGNLFDWWQGQTNIGIGFTYGVYQFIAVSSVNGNGNLQAGVWPWDGTTVPILN